MIHLNQIKTAVVLTGKILIFFYINIWFHNNSLAGEVWCITLITKATVPWRRWLRESQWWPKLFLISALSTQEWKKNMLTTALRIILISSHYPRKRRWMKTRPSSVDQPSWPSLTGRICLLTQSRFRISTTGGNYFQDTFISWHLECIMFFWDYWQLSSSSKNNGKYKSRAMFTCFSFQDKYF